MKGMHACVQSVSHQNTVITFSEKYNTHAHTHTHTHTLSPHATLPSPLSTYISPHLKTNKYRCITIHHEAAAPKTQSYTSHIHRKRRNIAELEYASILSGK